MRLVMTIRLSDRQEGRTHKGMGMTEAKRRNGMESQGAGIRVDYKDVVGLVSLGECNSKRMEPRKRESKERRRKKERRKWQRHKQ